MNNGEITIKLLLFFILYFVLPGFLVLRTFFSSIKLSIFSAIPFSFAASVALFFPLTFLQYIFGWPAFVLPLFSVCVSAIIVCYLLIVKKIYTLKISTADYSTGHVIATLLVLVIALIIVNSLNTNMDGDSLYHLSFVRKLTENANVSPYDALFKVDKIPASYGYNTWYLQLAGLNLLSQIDSTQSWLNISSVLIIVFLLSWGSLFEIIFPRKAYALIGMASLITFHGLFTGFFEWQLLPYPDQVAHNIFLPVILCIVLLALNSDNKRRLFFLISSMVAAVSFIHLFSFLAYALIIISLAIYFLLANKSEYFKSLVKISFFSLAAAAVFTLIKISAIGSFITNLSPISELRSDGAWISDSKFFIINPGTNLDIFRYILLGLFIIIAFIVIRRNRSRINSFWWPILIIITGLPFFILFNPLLVTYGCKIFTYTYIHRLWSLISFPLLTTSLAFLIYESSAQAKWRWYRSLYSNKYMIIIATACLLASPLLVKDYLHRVNINTYNETKPELYFSGNPELTDELISYINKNIPPRQIVFSDPWTSYRVASLSNNYVVTSLWQHFSPVIDRTKTTADAEFILSSPNIGQIITLLNKHGANYIVVNRPYMKYKAYYGLEDKLSSFSEFFHPVYENQNYIIYEYKFSDNLLSSTIQSLRKDALALSKVNNIEGSISKLQSVITLDNTNLDYINDYEYLRQKNEHLLSKDKTDILKFSAGAVLEDSSAFYPFPASLDALLDGYNYGDRDYAAATSNTLPNWFIFDLQTKRKIHSYGIDWLAAHTAGMEWDLFIQQNGNWQLIDSVKDWRETQHYGKIFTQEYTVQKIKMVIYRTHNSDRALIKNLNVY